MTRTSMFAALVFAVVAFGCNPKADPGATGPLPASTAAQPPAALVAKIVFIDMKEACDCTAKRTERSWAELQKATQGTDITVTRIHMDENGDEASKYSDMKPYVAIPAVYFFDGAGALAGMLQGEIAQAQLESMISGSQAQGPAPGLENPVE